MAKIEKISEDLADARERLVRTEVITDRFPIIEKKIEKFNELMQKVLIKQAVLIVKVGAVATLISTVLTAVLLIVLKDWLFKK